MRQPSTLMPSAPNHLPSFHEDSADHRIRRCMPVRPSRQRQCLPHVTLVTNKAEHSNCLFTVSTADADFYSCPFLYDRRPSLGYAQRTMKELTVLIAHD